MLGKLIKELRTDRYSQRELAQKLNISHSYISKIENSEDIQISDDLLSALANVLECDEVIMFSAANRIPPSFGNYRFNDHLSTYKNLKLRWLSMFNQETFSDRLSLLYHAFEASEMGYAIMRRDDLETVFVSEHMAKELSRYHDDQETLDLAKVIPSIHYIMYQYSLDSRKRRGILPLACGERVGFMEFFVHQFVMKDTQYFLLEMIKLHENLDGIRFALGADFCIEPYFENMALGLVVIRYDLLNNQPNLINCNTYFAKLLGYSRAELMKGVVPYNSLEVIMEAQIHRDQLILQRKSLSYPSVFIHKEGHYISAEVHAHMFDTGDDQGFIYLIKPLK